MPRTSSAIGPARAQRELRTQDILSAQTRLLFQNSTIGVGITILAATTLAVLQWGFAPRHLVLGWWLYMVLITVSRDALVRRYKRASPEDTEVSAWRAAFVVGAALAGIGWGGTAILLYPETHLTNQLFLVFILGGMMLGAGFLLAPRPEAFLAFLIPTGLIPTVRLVIQGDKMHSAMGLLTGVFTVATVITTARICRTLASSLSLQFENRGLLEDLRTAKKQTEALNQALELRVQERTAELNRSTE
jgi:hypothetical protein